MPRAGLTTGGVVDLALEILDGDAEADITLAAVAQRAGVATPSLYKHVRNLAELRSRVALRVLEDLTAAVADAVIGRSGDDAVRATMRAYRAYAVAYPGRYGAFPQQPLADVRLEPAGKRLTGIVLAVLRGLDRDGTEAIHAARALRSAAHGFAVLESAGGFGLPEDLDASYERMIEMVITGLRKS